MMAALINKKSLNLSNHVTAILIFKSTNNTIWHFLQILEVYSSNPPKPNDHDTNSCWLLVACIHQLGL